MKKRLIILAVFVMAIVGGSSPKPKYDFGAVERVLMAEIVAESLGWNTHKGE